MITATNANKVTLVTSFASEHLFVYLLPREFVCLLVSSFVCLHKASSNSAFFIYQQILMSTYVMSASKYSKTQAIRQN